MAMPDLGLDTTTSTSDGEAFEALNQLAGRLCHQTTSSASPCAISTDAHEIYDFAGILVYTARPFMANSLTGGTSNFGAGFSAK